MAAAWLDLPAVLASARQREMQDRNQSCDLVGRDHADVRSALGEQGRERIAEVEASAIPRASGRVSDR